MSELLEQLRRKINNIDHKILSLITDRSALLGDILSAKIGGTNSDQITVFDPKREEEVVRHLIAENSSVLPDAAIADIFQSIMGACRNVQIDQIDNAEPFQVSIQGSRGSYSEQAILQYCQNKSMGHHQIDFAVTSEKVLHAVTDGKSRFGIVALNNAHGGLVDETIQALSQSRYLIIDSVVLVVEHALLIRSETDAQSIQAIYSHPQALKQCREYLQQHYPDVEQIAWQDTALAASDLAAG
jgi:chorismate mutase/prephenate dehydratase